MAAVMTPGASVKAMAALQAEKEKAASKYKITVDRLMRKLNEELEAKETHTKFDGGQHGTRTWKYSKPLIAWKIRQEARRDAEAHLGIKPAEKVEMEHKVPPIRIVYVNPAEKKKSKVQIKRPGDGSR